MIENIAFYFSNLMDQTMSSDYKTQPCSTMKTIIAFDKFGNNMTTDITIRVEFPDDYEEIKHERVFPFFLRLAIEIHLIAGIHLGEFVGQCWRIHWVFSWSLNYATTRNNNGHVGAKEEMICCFLRRICWHERSTRR